MTAYEEDQIAFSVLSLVRDPLKDYTEQLARNVRSLQNIRQRLNEPQLEDIKAVLGTDGFDGLLLDADPAVGLTEESLMAIETPESGNGIHDNDLPQEYVRLVNIQQGIKTSILMEMQSRRDEEASVEVRRHDCSSAVEFWARTLASKGVIQDILRSIDGKDKKQ
jgi:ubiquitin carboxyl-terminal hydrolase L5